jgi:serine/threonine protein phosphatase 1
MDFDIPFEAAPGEELFLVGDIHGRSDLLDVLLNEVSGTPCIEGRSRTLVFLGDLIDRGPDSIGCLDRATDAGERVGADKVLGLLGNHEQMLRSALVNAGTERGELAAQNWLWNGGEQIVAELSGGTIPSEIDIVAALGERRLGWLAGLKSHYVSGRILAVHAGLNPAFAPDDFLALDWDVDFGVSDEACHWAWVRDPFLAHVPAGGEGHGGYFVVHGHTPPDYEPADFAGQLRRCRLNLDGGSYSTGKARMARIVGGRVTLCET